MAYREESVLRSPSLSRHANPDFDDLQGFIDEDLSILNSGEFGYQFRRRRVITSKCLIFTMIGLAVVGIAVGLGIALNKSGGSGQDASPPSSTSNTGNTEISGSVDIPQVPIDLHNICAPMNIQFDQGYNDCLALCQPAQCCEYVAENAFSCVEEHRQVCEKYRASCQHLDQKKATSSGITGNKVCSTKSLMTKEGVQACHDFCQPFKCCFDHSGASCNITEAVCSDNGACATALLVDEEGFASHAEAKDAVDSACQDMTTYKGQTQCSNTCNPAVCCFLSPSAWKQPCNVECDHYEACSALYGPILRHNTTDQDVFLSIPHQVEQACNPSQMATLTGIRGCLDLCQHHLCCFEEHESGGCSHTNPEECHLYSACRALFESGSAVEQPADSCTPSIVELEGPDECLQSCAKGYCCIVDARYEASCANDVICTTYYKACDILAPEKPEQEDPDLVANINHLCTAGNLASMFGASQCETSCSERGCCIETGAGNCRTSDRDYCDQVGNCQLIFEIDPTPEIDVENKPETQDQGKNVVTQTLEQVCNASNLATISGYHNCYDQCFYHVCCFADDSDLNCNDKTREVDCTTYAPCKVLLDASGAGNANLNDVCSLASVETASGLEQCRKQCAPYLCCFQDPNLPSSCVGWYGQRTCGQYEACKILVSDSSHTAYKEEDPYLVALIDKYCKPEVVANPETASHCMTQCEKRGCCYITGDCYETVSSQVNANPSDNVSLSLTVSSLQDKEWCDEISACLNHPLINAPDVLHNQTGTVSKLNETSQTMVVPIDSGNDDLDLFGNSDQDKMDQDIESGEDDIDLYAGHPSTL